MARPKDYSRLGFFLVLSLFLVATTTLFFVSKNSKYERIALVTFFEEPVTGLDAGATILLKGVKVGQVGEIHIDPASGYVKVDMEIDSRALRAAGVFPSTDLKDLIKDGSFPIPENLRVKILRNPIMGTAQLLIDTLANPPKPLPLARKPERPYIPSMPSPESSFFTSLEKVTVQVPQMLERSNEILSSIEQTLTRIKLEELVDESISLAKSSRQQIETVGGDLHSLLKEQGSLKAYVSQASADLTEMRKSLEGMVAFAKEEVQKARIQETSAKIRTVLDSLDGLGQSGDLLTAELRDVIPSLEAALEEIRALARALREQPDSLIYGREKPGLRKK